MNNIKRVVAPLGWLTITLTGLVTTSLSFAAQQPEINDALIALGEATYQRECSSCHGTEGAGDGPGAHYLNPKPRNFQLGVYKFRSTPSGEVPTEDDLYKTISNGLYPSMMPAFNSLSERERWALVEVVRRFGAIENETAQAIEVSEEPPVSDALLKLGAKVYDRLECMNCHGVNGWSTGPSSTTLENDAKERVHAPALANGSYKGGDSGLDLYMRIANGLDGSPMPSYSAEASPEEIWSVVHYLRSLVK